MDDIQAEGPRPQLTRSLAPDGSTDQWPRAPSPAAQLVQLDLRSAALDSGYRERHSIGPITNRSPSHTQTAATSVDGWRASLGWAGVTDGHQRSAARCGCQGCGCPPGNQIRAPSIGQRPLPWPLLWLPHSHPPQTPAPLPYRRGIPARGFEVRGGPPGRRRGLSISRAGRTPRGARPPSERAPTCAATQPSFPRAWVGGLAPRASRRCSRRGVPRRQSSVGRAWPPRAYIPLPVERRSGPLPIHTTPVCFTPLLPPLLPIIPGLGGRAEGVG